MNADKSKMLAAVKTDLVAHEGLVVLVVRQTMIREGKREGFYLISPDTLGCRGTPTVPWLVDKGQWVVVGRSLAANHFEAVRFDVKVVPILFLRADDDLAGAAVQLVHLGYTRGAFRRAFPLDIHHRRPGVPLELLKRHLILSGLCSLSGLYSRVQVRRLLRLPTPRIP